tara:strand:- start:262 stop:399 length:138 start_codon:yes stop_codon:yes gene_type:complete
VINRFWLINDNFFRHIVRNIDSSFFDLSNFNYIIVGRYGLILVGL